MSERENDHEEKDQDSPKEPMFSDGEREYTWDEWFHPPEEEEKEKPVVKKSKRGLKLMVAGLAITALLVNVFQLWPQLFNLPAAEFVQISRELSDDSDVQTYREGVVVVNAGDSQGTGLFYDEENGYILTNEHVIEEDPYPSVTFENGDSYQAEVIQEAEEYDMAVLRIDNPSSEHHAFSFDREVEDDEEAYIIGNPLFFNHIANQGEVIGTYEASQIEGDVLMVDAPIYQGSSGSPLINENGDVFAVVYATTRVDVGGESQRVGLAVSADSFYEWLP